MLLEWWDGEDCVDTRKELREYAATISHVLKPFPGVLQMSEDGTDLTSRMSVHPSSWRLCLYEGWVQDLPSSWITAGLLDSVKWLKYEEKKMARLTPELSLWIDEAFQQLVYMILLESIERFKDPLLVSPIPGLPKEEQTAPACSNQECHATGIQSGGLKGTTPVATLGAVGSGLCTLCSGLQCLALPRGAQPPFMRGGLQGAAEGTAEYEVVYLLIDFFFTISYPTNLYN
jgi:hypothetical protein